MSYWLGYGLGLMTGGAFGLSIWLRAKARHHRQIGDGFRYLSIVWRRRPIEAVDPFVAFTDDPMADALRREMFAADETGGDQ